MPPEGIAHIALHNTVKVLAVDKATDFTSLQPLVSSFIATTIINQAYAEVGLPDNRPGPRVVKPLKCE